ncbi:MAG: type VI secretion system tip protein VgrG [Desulfobacteraceae bacterium]|nr:MAG: type VI secretion system tip protein VgrG [Desulfobacteraceae bacterium]
MDYTQENKSLIINTSLGADELLLTGFRGREGISRPFAFELELVSENHNIAFKDIVGKAVAVTVTLFEGEKRHFHGLVSRFVHKSGKLEKGEYAPRFSRYSATMVPWLWLLTKTKDSRIFQNLSVPDIIEKIFKDAGFSDYQLKLSGSYAEKVYCVQYNETDYNFVSRLMEQEGLFYFFQHEEKKHTLIIADSPDEHKPCSHQASARYQNNAGGWQEEDVITDLTMEQEIRAGKYSVNDYNFEMPNADLKVEVTTQHDLGPGEREVYDYPARFSKRDEGDRLANLRMQAEEASITTIKGSSTCRDFASGFRFELKGFYRSDMNNKAYVLTVLDHEASEPVEASGHVVPTYSNRFSCTPHEVPFRPPLVTPKPVVEGTQPAVVVGPSGEEIYTDKYGRVKVQFVWDREGKKDENSSCWVRVSQPWAGAGWGAMFIPRIGQEVIVDFIEGDPDRPIITGRVYHGANSPPYSLPDEKTKSTLKSNSSTGGGGFNEIRFEDKKGSEEIYIHGQKDWTIAIENDKNQTIGHDETLKVANDRTKAVDKNEDETIGENKSISVGKSHTESISENMSVSVGKKLDESTGDSKSVSVGKSLDENITESATYMVGKNRSITVTEKNSVDIGKDHTEKIGKKMTLTVGDDAKFSIDKNLSIIVNEKTVINSSKEIALNCGGASIILKKDGKIQIKGKDINITASGNVQMKGSKISEN